MLNKMSLLLSSFEGSRTKARRAKYWLSKCAKMSKLLWRIFFVASGLQFSPLLCCSLSALVYQNHWQNDFLVSVFPFCGVFFCVSLLLHILCNSSPAFCVCIFEIVVVVVILWVYFCTSPSDDKRQQKTKTGWAIRGTEYEEKLAKEPTDTEEQI